MEKVSPSDRTVSRVTAGYLSLIFLIPFLESVSGFIPLLPILFTLSVGILTLFLAGKGAGRVSFPLPAILFGIWVLVECFLAANWDRSFGLLGIWSLSLLLGISAWNLSRIDPRFPRRLCLALWVTASFIAAVSPGQAPNLDDLAREAERTGVEETFKEAILHAASQDRLNFPFGNPIHLGLFLVLTLLATPAVFRWAGQADRPGLMKTAVGVTALVQALTFWGTKSRTPLLALGVGCLIWIGWERLTRRRTLIAGGLFLALAVAALVASPTGREMIGRVETVRARLIYWNTGAAMIRDAPLLGYGIGGYGDRYPEYRGPTPHQTQYPHNLPIEVMTDQGAIGLMLFLFLLFTLLRAKRREAEGGSFKGRAESDRKGEDPWVESWLLASLGAFGLSTLSDFPHDMFYLCGLFGALAGTALGLRGEWKPGGLSVRVARPVWIGMIVLMLIPVLLRESGEFFFERARGLHIQKGPSETERLNRIREEVKNLERAVAIWPPNAQAHHFLGRLLTDLGNPIQGRKQLEQALYWSPNTPFLYEDLAILDWNLGNKEAALATLDRAIAKHPVKWNYHATKSRWLHDLGKTQEAVAEKRLAESLKTLEPDYLQARREQAPNRTEGEP